nr:MAG TPA: chromosome partition protein [Caudoviricetes sp.]
MKLLKLKLTNFEGISSFEISPEGKSMTIYGDNGTGKTTIADAQNWLLFGKDSTFTANFSPKMRDENGEEIHNTDCSVQAVYELDGVQVTLEKTMREDWKKKRGSKETVFSGHTISYSIDGVPKKEKEFSDFLSSVADMQTVMLLSVPKYFPEILDIRKRRAMLMALTSDISDLDVIGSNEELKPLLHLMLKPGSTQLWYGIDEFMKICKANAAESNARLKELPGRIDEVNRSVCENTSDRTSEEIRTEISKLSAQKTALQLKMNASGSQMINSLRTDISKAELELAQLKTQYAENARAVNENAMEKISSLTAEKYSLQGKADRLDAEKQKTVLTLERLKKERCEVMDEYVKTQEEKFSGSTVCPTCGQAVPEEQIRNAMEQFSLHKSQRLEKLNAYGREHCSKDMIQQAEKQLAELDDKISEICTAIKKTEADIAEANAQIIYSEPFECTEEYKAAQKKTEGIRAQIAMLERSENSAKAETAALISETEDMISKLNAELAKNEAAQKGRKRMEELEKQEKNFAESYAKAQQGITLCELFSRVKADMLTDKINGRFKNVRFRLFKTQINGGIADDCEVMALTSNGYIPYSTANNAARINAGLEVIRTFSAQTGVSMPVFVDNAESVTKLDPNGLQVIRLVVSENDKTLRSEREEF